MAVGCQSPDLGAGTDEGGGEGMPCGPPLGTAGHPHPSCVRLRSVPTPSETAGRTCLSARPAVLPWLAFVDGQIGHVAVADVGVVQRLAGVARAAGRRVV